MVIHEIIYPTPTSTVPATVSTLVVIHQAGKMEEKQERKIDALERKLERKIDAVERKIDAVNNDISGLKMEMTRLKTVVWDSYVKLFRQSPCAKKS